MAPYRSAALRLSLEVSQTGTAWLALQGRELYHLVVNRVRRYSVEPCILPGQSDTKLADLVSIPSQQGRRMPRVLPAVFDLSFSYHIISCALRPGIEVNR